MILFVLPKEVTQMAKYTLEDIMYGDKYGIESAVFVEVFKMVEEKIDAKTIREQLNTIYVKHSKSILLHLLMIEMFKCILYGTDCIFQVAVSFLTVLQNYFCRFGID